MKIVAIMLKLMTGTFNTLLCNFRDNFAMLLRNTWFKINKTPNVLTCGPLGICDDCDHQDQCVLLTNYGVSSHFAWRPVWSAESHASGFGQLGSFVVHFQDEAIYLLTVPAAAVLNVFDCLNVVR